MSIGLMSCSAIAARCASLALMCRIPPCTFGCSVFTRPSSISGKPVYAPMSVTGTPAARSMPAVPPVDRISISKVSNARARSSTPVLLETLISARRMDGIVQDGWDEKVPRAAHRTQPSLDAVTLDLLAQGVAVEAEQLGGDGLIAADFVQHHLDQRLFHAADDHGVDLSGLLPIQIAEVAVQCSAHAACNFIFVDHAASSPSP